MLEACLGLPAQNYMAIACTIGLRDEEDFYLCIPDAKLHPALSLALGHRLPRVMRGSRTVQLQEQLSAKPIEQIYFALGASASLKALTLIILDEDDLKISQWTCLLKNAAHLRAPVIFVVVSRCRNTLAALGSRLEVPGIPVDAADPIALYRVAAESFGRACAGGGPTLIEAVTFPDSPDALTLLRRQMLSRGAATKRWTSALEERVLAQTKRSPEKVH